MNKTGDGVKLYLFVVLFIMIIPCAAMGQKVRVSGYVKDSVSGAPLYPATIFDQTSGTATYADSSGYYSMLAEAGDQLIYSYIGYYSVSYRVPVALREVVHQVGMLSRREQLKEVTIKGLTPYQADSAERIKTFKNYMDKPDYPFVLGAGAGMGFGLSLNLDRFTKESRRKRRFHKMFPQFERDAFVNSRYTPQLVTKLTGLKGDSLTLFLYHFKPPYEFTRYASDLEFWSWIKMKYTRWVTGEEREDEE